MTAAALDGARRRLLEADRCVRDHGITVEEAGDGSATASLIVSPAMANGHGICHGGITFMLADAAMAYAATREGSAVVSQTASVTFTAPAAVGDHLVATCRRTWQGGRSGAYDVEVRRAAGELVAMVRITALHRAAADGGTG